MHVILLSFGTIEAILFNTLFNTNDQLFHHYTVHSTIYSFSGFLPPLLIFFSQIGPNGYYFAIDPNGYVLLHPNLQPKVWYLALCITQRAHSITLYSDYSIWFNLNGLCTVNDMQASRWCTFSSY